MKKRRWEVKKMKKKLRFLLFIPCQKYATRVFVLRGDRISHTVTPLS